MGLDAHDIARQLSAARTRSERSRIVTQIAQSKGVSKQAVYKAAHTRGQRFNNKKREDAGSMHLPGVTPLHMSHLTAFLYSSITEKKILSLTPAGAIEMAERAGAIPAGVVKPAYLTAWMRRQGISFAQALAPTPHSRLRSLHPNHVHIIDASQCAQWYLDDSGTVRHQRRNDEVYSNKEGDPRKITRLLLVDHFSGCIYLGYVQEENALAWIDLLYHAWTSKEFLTDRVAPYIGKPETCFSQTFPFRGFPKILFSDKGAALVSKNTQRILDHLGIRFITHKKGNPQAKGANETMQRWVERWFEGRLKYRPARSLEELNALAFAFSLETNARRIMSRNRQRFIRTEHWQQHAEGHIRDLPDYCIYKAFATSEPEPRKVRRDLTVYFKPRTLPVPIQSSFIYRLPAEWVDLIGTVVLVNFSLYEYPNVRIVSELPGREPRAIVCQPITLDAGHFQIEHAGIIGETFNALPHTTTQRNLAALQDLPPIIPVAKKHDPLTAAVHNPTAHQSAPAHDAHEGQAFTKPAEEVTLTVSKYEARRIILNHCCVDHVAQLSDAERSVYESIDGPMPRRLVDDLIAQITAITTAPQILTLEQGGA
jgi:hypothetical protein